MKSFKFTLESALQWRKTILAAEQEKLQRALANHHRLEVEGRSIDAEQRGVVRTQLESPDVCGADFRSIAAYLVGLKAKRAQLQLAVAQSSQSVQRQQAICAESERQVELLETLKEKRRQLWQREADVELELLATESYLARRSRDGE